MSKARQKLFAGYDRTTLGFVRRKQNPVPCETYPIASTYGIFSILFPYLYHKDQPFMKVNIPYMDVMGIGIYLPFSYANMTVFEAIRGRF